MRTLPPPTDFERPTDDDHEDAERGSRRRFFALGASVAAASLASASTALAQQTTAKKPSAVRGMVKKLLNQVPDPAFSPFKKVTISTKGWDSALTRLVRSVTYGVTEDELKLANKLGFYGYLNYHLSPTKIEDGAAQNWVAANAPLLDQVPATLYSQDQRVVQDQLITSIVYRAAFSKRQLQERLSEFWSDHFNIEYDKVRYLKLVDDREVIRKHLLGKFPAMLRASAHSPAMLEYLDNTRNRRTTLNENYAREIMELHTVGVNSGYSQDDVRELARCFTGWTMAGRGDFNFDATGHDYAEKNVWGVRVPALPQSSGAAGKADADGMITWLLNHRKTAEYVSWKMLRFFLQYDPTPAQVAAVANVYTKTAGDIPTMMRTVLTPANLLAAPPKYKRPYTFMVGAMRATMHQPNVAKVDTLSFRYLPLLGQGMFQWEMPDGYPDRPDYWAGGVLQRWNFAVYVSTTTSTEASMDLTRFWDSTTATNNSVDSVMTAISRHLFGGEMPDRLKANLRQYLSAGTLSVARTRETIALALSSSTFNWA